jgi:hypothetical protein
VFAHRRQDRFHDTVDVPQHVIVPEPQNAVALRLKIRRPLCIPGNVLGLIVLRSINFDDEAPFMTGEVSEEGTDSGLPPKV